MKNGFLILLVFLLSRFVDSSAQNFWQPSDGPNNGATINDYLKLNNATLLIGTTEGLIRSDNNGSTWDRLNGIPGISCLALDSLNTIYAGYSGHLLRSTDSGDTWSTIYLTGNIRDILIAYRDTLIICTSDEGLLRSFDYGQTWTTINSGISYPDINKIIRLFSGVLLVGSNGGGVYKSINWGNYWNASNTGLPLGNDTKRYVYSFVKTNSLKIFCGSQNGIYSSVDNGTSWVWSSAGMNDQIINDLIFDQNGNLFAGAKFNGVYASIDQGNNWFNIGLNYTINCLGLDHGLNLCAGSKAFGLCRYSYEDSTWSRIYNRGYTPTETDILSMGDTVNIYAGTWWWGLYKTTDAGHSWNQANFKGLVETIITIDSTTLVIGSSGQYYGVYLSHNAGDTWSRIGNYDVSSLFYDSARQILFVGTYGSGNGPGIYSTTDLGQNWELINNVGPSCFASWLNSLIITNTDNYMFADCGCFDQHSGTTYRLYRSTDAGQSWEFINYSNMFDFIENSEGDLYAINYYKLFLSHDRGLSWITRNIEASCLAVDNMDRVYYGYGGTVKASDKEALNWTTVGNYLGYGINDIVISQNNMIYLATDNGVYYGNANNFVLSSEDIPEIITTFSLSQNYPNPFNPSTKISYQIPEQSKVKLTVYDVLGREIKTLVNEEKSAGFYEVEFNGSDIPSGVYFYRIETANYTDTKKFILLK